MFQRTRLWPKPDTHIDGMKPVSGGHQIHFQSRGRTTGKPVVFLHGGPGRGCENSTWSFFNPRVWRVILVDQRGSGASTPRGCLTDNTTADLVSDLEALREHLAIEKWTVFGSGWGAFLGLAYAMRHPTHTTELIINDILLLRRKDIDWLFKFGASEHFPDAWEKFLEPLSADGRADPLSSYHRIFTEGTAEEQKRAAMCWGAWEAATSGNPQAAAADPDSALTLAKLECHYFYNQGFMEPGKQILDDIGILREHKIPGVIVHGEWDMVNPIAHARDLHLAWPEAHFVSVPGAGHSVTEPAIRTALLAATEEIGGCGCLFKWPVA